MSTGFRTIVVGLALAVGTSATPLTAQFIVGWNLGGAVPTSDLGDIVQTGGGASFFVGQMVSDSWMLKIDVGYWAFTSEEIRLEGIQPFDVDGGVTPIRLGVRKYWGESMRFYSGPSVGVYIPGGDLEGLDSKLGLGPQIGYSFPVGDGSGSFDINLEFHTIFIGDENPLTGQDRTYFDSSKMSFLTLGVGYTMRSPGS